MSHVGHNFQGIPSYPLKISPEYCGICKMQTSVRGKRKMDDGLWNTLARTDPYSYATWLIHIWHDSCMTRLTHTRRDPQLERSARLHEQSLTIRSVTWIIHMWRDWFMCHMNHSHATWPTTWTQCRAARTEPRRQKCDMNHSCVTWLIHMWHDSLTRNVTHNLDAVRGCTSRASLIICVTWLIHMWHDSFICDMTH